MVKTRPEIAARNVSSIPGSRNSIIDFFNHKDNVLTCVIEFHYLASFRIAAARSGSKGLISMAVPSSNPAEMVVRGITSICQ